ncbi:MAG: hypothetical protein VYB64_08925, partial [Pseudomonadota bacterium]|nr:hypothetical protein [Pseudomonadota bacterium]
MLTAGRVWSVIGLSSGWPHLQVRPEPSVGGGGRQAAMAVDCGLVFAVGRAYFGRFTNTERT